jgi:hypothetical protein
MTQLLSSNLFFASALIVSLAAFLKARPPRSHQAVTAAAGLAATALAGWSGDWYVRIMLLLDYWSLFAILLVAAAPYFRIRYPRHRELVVHMLFPPLAAALTVVFLAISALLRPVTLDRYLYAFDGSLGFQPGAWAARFLLDHRALLSATEFAYMNLALGMGLVYLALADRSRIAARRTLTLYIAIAVCGYFCYYLFPGAGSAVVFGPAFPLHLPAVGDLRIEPIPVRFSPRNCMPSLHTSWVIAMFWSTRGFSRVARLAAGVFAALTLCYALSQHYLVDLVAALPFTLALYAATRGRAAWQIPACRVTAGAAATLFAGWLLALRWGIQLFVGSPLAAWLCVAVTLLAFFTLKFTLERALSSAQSESSLPEPGARRGLLALEPEAGAAGDR